MAGWARARSDWMSRESKSTPFFGSLAKLEGQEKETAASAMVSAFGRLAQTKNWDAAQIFLTVQNAMDDSLVPVHIGEAFLDKYLESQCSKMLTKSAPPEVPAGGSRNEADEKRVRSIPLSQPGEAAAPSAGCITDSAGVERDKKEPRRSVKQWNPQDLSLLEGGMVLMLVIVDSAKVNLMKVWGTKKPVNWIQSCHDGHNPQESRFIRNITPHKLRMSKFKTAEEFRNALEVLSADPSHLYTIKNSTMILQYWMWDDLFNEIKNPKKLVGQTKSTAYLRVFSPLVTMEPLMPIPNLTSLEASKKRELPPRSDKPANYTNEARDDKKLKTDPTKTGMCQHLRCSICSKIIWGDLDEGRLATKGWIWQCHRNWSRHIVCFRGKALNSNSTGQLLRHAELEFLGILALDIGFTHHRDFVWSTENREAYNKTKRVLKEIARRWDGLQSTWADRIQKSECPKCVFSSRRYNTTGFLEWLRFLNKEYCTILEAMGRCALTEFASTWRAFEMEAEKKIKQKREKQVASAIRSFWN